MKFAMKSWGQPLSWRVILTILLAAMTPPIIAALYIMYPPPKILLDAMWLERKALLEELQTEAWENARAHLRTWQSLAGRLPTATRLRDGKLAAEAEVPTLALQESLAALEDALLSGDGSKIRHQAVEAFERHRLCAAIYHALPVETTQAEVHTSASAGAEWREMPSGEPRPTLAIAVLPDPQAGWNLKLQTSNFRFSPGNVSRAHIPGEGYARLTIDQGPRLRIYGEWYHIPELPPGTHTLKVTLCTNDHAAYTIDGAPITAEARVTVAGPVFPPRGAPAD